MKKPRQDGTMLYEKRKYQQVWAHGAYRKFSPGEQEHARAVTQMGMRQGNSVIDFGCGEGKSVKFFDGMGMPAYGIEFAPNAPSEKGIVVLEACLWDVPEMPPVDFGFCCDVMEHIPPEKVDAVLETIRRMTLKRTYFRISTVADRFGPDLIGKQLHLVVANLAWWETKFAPLWKETRVVEETAGHFTVVCDGVAPRAALKNRHLGSRSRAT